MSYDKCPVCGFYTYEHIPGYWEPQGPQIDPDIWICHNACCGFDHQQHCDPERSEQKMAERHRRELKKRRAK